MCDTVLLLSVYYYIKAFWFCGGERRWLQCWAQFAQRSTRAWDAPMLLLLLLLQ